MGHRNMGYDTGIDYPYTHIDFYYNGCMVE